MDRDPRDRYNNCKLLAIRERSVPVESTSWAALVPALLLGLREGLEAALILGLVAAMSVYITVKMVQGAKQEIAAKKGRV